MIIDNNYEIKMNCVTLFLIVLSLTEIVFGLSKNECILLVKLTHNHSNLSNKSGLYFEKDKSHNFKVLQFIII